MGSIVCIENLTGLFNHLQMFA